MNSLAAESGKSDAIAAFCPAAEIIGSAGGATREGHRVGVPRDPQIHRVASEARSPFQTPRLAPEIDKTSVARTDTGDYTGSTHATPTSAIASSALRLVLRQPIHARGIELLDLNCVAEIYIHIVGR